MKLRSFLILIILSAVSGCATDGGQQYSAQMSVTRNCERSSTIASDIPPLGYCYYYFKLTNSQTSSNYIEPELKVLVTDCDGNTIVEDRIIFNTILRGKYQTKQEMYKKSEDGTSLITVLLAESGWEGYGEVKLLQGVHGWEYKWGCN